MPRDLLGMAQEAMDHGTRKLVTGTACGHASQPRGCVGGNRLCGALRWATLPFALRALGESEGRKPVQQFAAVQRADIGVLDRIDMSQQACLEPSLVFGRAQFLRVALETPQGIEKAGGCCQQLLHR
ncbi:MAG: hypothetical protein ACO25F_11425, partial [Erythrobacter sp.]